MDAIAVVTDTMKRICARGFDPHTAPWEHKVCVMLHATQGIIDNGGFEYFFEAPFEGRPEQHDFPLVFEAVGAYSSAATIRKAIERSRSPRAHYEDLDAVMWRESKSNLELLAAYIARHAASYA